MCKNRKLNWFDHFQRDHPRVCNFVGSFLLITAMIFLFTHTPESYTVYKSATTQEIVQIEDNEGRVVSGMDPGTKYRTVWVK